MFRNRPLLLVFSVVILLLGLLGTGLWVRHAQAKKQEAEVAATVQNDFQNWKAPTHVPVTHESMKFKQ